MKILFVVPYVPSLIRVRPFNFIRALSARGHRLTVLTLYTSEAELKAVEELRNCVHQVIALPMPAWRSLFNCLLTLPTSNPLQAAYSWQPELAREIGRKLDSGGGFDVVHIEHLRGVRYGLHVRRLNGSTNGGQLRPPVVWDSVDSIAHLFRQASGSNRKRLSRWLTRFELGRTEVYEGRLVPMFARTLVTSNADRNAFVNSPYFNGDPERVTVLPNGVDLDYFSPDPQMVRDPDALVISGKMSYHANINMVLHFIRDILPRIWNSRPEIKVWIVGKEPPAEIQRLSQDPRIKVTGMVDDLRPYLKQAALAVAPLTYGAGIQNKVLEAMACATPVVTTPLAMSALKAQPGKEIVIAEEDDCFADMVLQLLEEPQARELIGQQGRRYVEKNHNWWDIAGQLEGVYDEVIGEFSRLYVRH